VELLWSLWAWRQRERALPEFVRAVFGLYSLSFGFTWGSGVRVLDFTLSKRNLSPDVMIWRRLPALFRVRSVRFALFH